MKNYPWFKIYLVLIIIVSLAFISVNILAQVEQTPEDLKAYIKEGNCPYFVEVNELTMKDQCTGLVWARKELPSYHGTANPGYSWDEAKNDCDNYMKADLDGNGSAESLFRLPTVEELLSLIKYKCDASSCGASLDLDLNNDGQSDYLKPFFSNGFYWSINDYNEPAYYRDPNAKPTPGSAARDYKRSVNLLNGEVDSPVFGINMRLNAWCVMDRKPEIKERKFVAVSTSAGATGITASGGQIKTIYNRRCVSFDPDCKNSYCTAGANLNKPCNPAQAAIDCPGGTCKTVTIGNACESGYCVDNPSSNNFNFAVPQIVSCNKSACSNDATKQCNTILDCGGQACNTGYHNVNNSCVMDKTSPVTGCGLKKCSNNPDKICAGDGDCPGGLCKYQGYQVWKGNDFNGYNVCILDICPNGQHQDPSTFLCVSNFSDCTLYNGACDLNNAACDLTATCDPATAGACKNWVLHAQRTWDVSKGDWGACQADQCLFDAEPGASCACPSPKTVRDGYCTKCTATQHYELDASKTTYEACQTAGGAWSGSACFVCADNLRADCGFCKGGANAGASCTAATAAVVCTGEGATCDFTDQLANIKEQWTGSLLSGNYACTFQSCKATAHAEPTGSANCVANTRACTPSEADDPYKFVTAAAQNWDPATSTWGPCNVTACVIGTSLQNNKCICPTSSETKVIRRNFGSDGYACTYCGNGIKDVGQGEACDLGCTTKVCQGGTTDGWYCDDVTDCVCPVCNPGTCTDNVCVGGEKNGFACTSNNECLCTPCESGTACVANTSDWGQGAVCKPVPMSPAPKAAEIVFIVDTSPSIDTPMSNICEVTATAQANIISKNIIPAIKIYGIADSTVNSTPTAAGACYNGVSANVTKKIFQQITYSGCYNIYTTDEGCKYQQSQAACSSYHPSCSWNGSACVASTYGCDAFTDSASCTAGCTWNASFNKCERNFTFCSNLNNHTDCSYERCNSFTKETTCVANSFCKWETSCVPKAGLNAKCKWNPQITYGCGDGYIYSNLTYFNPPPEIFVAHTRFCTEDWVSSTITAINELSNVPGKNSSSLLDWNSNSKRVIVLVFDETPWYGNDKPFKADDYAHMQSSKRTVTLGQSLIGLAKDPDANPLTVDNVSLSLIYTRDLCDKWTSDQTGCNADTTWNCSWATDQKHCIDACGAITNDTACNSDAKCTWQRNRCIVKEAADTATTCNGWTWPTANYDTIKNRFCAMKKIASETGGVFQFGNTIMSSTTSTATAITNAVVQTFTEQYCDNSPADTIMDCSLR
jgi:hypothetical protein